MHGLKGPLALAWHKANDFTPDSLDQKVSVTLNGVKGTLYSRNTMGVQLNYTLAMWPSGFFFFFQFYQDIIDAYQYIILGR